MNIDINNKNYNFDIDKIINYLSSLKDSLPKLYNWETPTDKTLLEGLNIGLFTKKDIKLLSSKDSYFYRNDLMKSIINKKLTTTKNKEILTKYYYWIIKDWGGIKGIKEEGLYDRIHDSINMYKNSFEVPFDKISSTTKAMNFIDPKEFIIYDSRVAYALNWIILKTNAGNQFFSIPQGRNSKLCAFDMPTLIRLHNINNYKALYNNNPKDKRLIYNADKSIFIPEKHCYYVMCEIFKEIAKNLWNDSSLDCYPYYTEMLLFSIADTFVFEDILNTICISKK